MDKITFITEKRKSQFNDGWSRKVSVAGVAYWVGVDAGKRVRIPYKPRGPGAYGYEWHGFVRDEQGKTIWGGRVVGSLGARGLLLCAGVIEEAAV